MGFMVSLSFHGFHGLSDDNVQASEPCEPWRTPSGCDKNRVHLPQTSGFGQLASGFFNLTCPLDKGHF